MNMGKPVVLYLSLLSTLMLGGCSTLWKPGKHGEDLTSSLLHAATEARLASVAAAMTASDNKCENDSPSIKPEKASQNPVGKCDSEAAQNAAVPACSEAIAKVWKKCADECQRGWTKRDPDNGEPGGEKCKRDNKRTITSASTEDVTREEKTERGVVVCIVTCSASIVCVCDP